MIMYKIEDWYWVVAGSTTDAWSSKRAVSVPVDDAEYAAWLAIEGHSPTRIASMADLEQMFSENYPGGSLRTYCLDARWRLESGGMTLTSGMPIKTDDRAKARIAGAFSAAAANPAFTTKWHAADHTIHLLDKTQIDAMNAELNAFVEAAFAISSDVLAQIETGIITTREQIDAAFGIPPTHYKRPDPWDV